MPKKRSVLRFGALGVSGNVVPGSGGGGEEAPESTASHYYIRDGGSPTGSGADWTNARDDFPTTLARNTTYWIATGTYAGKTFSTAASGTTRIQIRKATTAYHGTDTGWNAAYGTGVATFNGELVFTTAYWTLDGAVGGGPGSWTSGHGIKCDAVAANRSFSGSANGMRFKHLEIQGGADTTSTVDGIELYVGDDMHVAYVYTHDTDNCPLQTRYVTGCIVEYSYFGSFYAVGDPNPHGETWSCDYTDDVDFRYNIVIDCQSTGGLMLNNETQGTAGFRIYGNVFYETAARAWESTNGFIGGWTNFNLDNTLVYNNTFVLCSPVYLGDGVTPQNIFGGNAGTGCNVKNNLFYDTNDLGDLGGGATFTHNHFISTTTKGTNTSTGTGDPFVDYVNLDFRLEANTTAGTNLGAPYDVDMFGNTRTTWTRGALEYV